ncbi:MAG: hypothetical protein ACRDRV_14955 [Pseudonocardiaceae bacterium]
MHRGSAAIAVLAALFVGLLTVGPLAGCSSRQPAPETPPPGPVTGLPTAAPLPLPRPQPPGGPAAPEPGLSAKDRALLTEARRVGAQWVVLLVSTEPARTAEVSAALERLGGVIGTTSPGVDYLRLTMPTGQVGRATTLPHVTALDIEQIITPHKPRPTG